MKSSPELSLLESYKKRITWNFNLIELEAKKGLSGDKLREQESNLLLNSAPQNSYHIVLDERGKTLTSPEFADIIKHQQDNSSRHISFFIGGADGHTHDMRSRADKIISFGSLTWPHMLVRVMLVEQIYRAQTILQNHPYHRS